MKTFLLILSLSVILISCSNSDAKTRRITENSGIVTALNGKNKMDSLKFTCDSCDKYLTVYAFDTLVIEASRQAKEGLRNKLSFIPVSMDIKITKLDSLRYATTNKLIDSCVLAYITYKCIGQNAYGVENEVETDQYIYFVNNQIKDISSKLKKTELAFLDESKTMFNRSLYAFDDDKTIKVVIHKSPYTGWGFIVNTDETCVDEGARLTLHFDNEEKITLRSWNKFNCNSNSYYNLPNSAIEKMKNTKIEYVSFYDDETIFGVVSENDTDYFQQFARLVSN